MPFPDVSSHPPASSLKTRAAFGRTSRPPRRPKDRRELLRRASKILASLAEPVPGSAATSFVPMRTAEGFSRGLASKALPQLPPLGVIALHRMGFGPRPGDLSYFRGLGASADERLAAYVDEQLDPLSLDDSEAEARIAAAGYTTLGKSLTQLWADHEVDDYMVRRQPLAETVGATFLRAVYSRRQLLEVMADFWHNHFNVHGTEWDFMPTWVHYDRDVIRAHALGNFRQMLEAVAMAPAMLFYLDNAFSADDGPNENYSRELFELHTLGADAYLGVQPQANVPADASGVPTGWVDDDIKEAARCFTGWTVDAPYIGPNDTGTFYYLADWHDDGAKNVLGRTLPAGQAALQDGRDVLDFLAEHPATARHIALKLCRRLVADFPPAEVVDAAAATFTAEREAPDQIARTVRTILLSDAFRTTWGEKTKRPFEIAASALRAGGSEISFALGDGPTDTFFYLYSHTGQTLFDWPAPNGYPDLRGAWTSTTPRAMSWRLVNWLVDARDGADTYLLDVVAQTPADVRSANALADFWIDRILGRPMDAPERQEIVELMAQGFNPSFDLPLGTDEDVRSRLRAMVGLIFMSPAFLWR